ncbi:MAG TPA: cytochrome C oxidase subunit I, partial [Burkholderiales bacterium]|nr:cytochrome C oxidase subunit I [Burkholderiales bacterium]
MKRGRVKLLLLAALFVTPPLAGWIVYVMDWTPGATANYGTLVEPRPIAAEPLARLRGKWVLVQIDASSCAKPCEQKLYYMRQVRRAQGRQMQRVERLWILTDAGTPASALAPLTEGLQLARGDASLIAAFPAERAPADHIYLVDPLGNLMLRFPRDPQPGKMVKDLE